MEHKAEVISNFVKLYRRLAEIPTVNCGQLMSRTPGTDFIKVSSVWSQRNIELGEITKFQKNFVVKASSSELVFESPPTDVSMQELSRTSASEKLQCIVRKTKAENKKKQFIEIWSQKGLFRNFDISAFDVHGEIYTDGEFGTLEWSPNEEKVLYVAEQKTKKNEPFYKQKSDEAENAEQKVPVKGDEYIYKPDWGEQLVDKHQPVVGVCDIKSETLKVLQGIPPNFSPGQLIWSKDGNGIFGIVLDNEPRRLGLVYCTNRTGYVFHLTLTGEFKILSELNKSVRSPRLSPDGNSLFWLQRPVNGVHHGCQQLVRLDLTTKKSEILVDVVRSVGKTFSGLYLHQLPKRCFSKDGTKMFFSTCNKLKNSSYYLDLGTKTVHLLETGEGSSTILDVHDDNILISTDTVQSSPALKMATSITKPAWIPLTKSENVSPTANFKEIEFESKTGNHKFTYYNGLFYGPAPTGQPAQKVPLILYPHGGPHSAFLNSYAFEPNFLVALGYGVLMINYRGSTGVGQDGVDFLPGKIGDTDVKDCHEAVLQVLKDVPYLDEKRVFLLGGSHGGFLVGHLSAQYPDFYRAVVTRNPVIDVSAMYFMSDIPDWATGESALNFDESKPLNAEQINKMIAASPIHLLDKIKAPTLFQIGKKDLRVPFYEGIKMFNALKARKVKVKLHIYDDNHPLGSVPVHIDCLINAALWFLENQVK